MKTEETDLVVWPPLKKILYVSVAFFLFERLPTPPLVTSPFLLCLVSLNEARFSCRFAVIVTKHVLPRSLYSSERVTLNSEPKSRRNFSNTFSCVCVGVCVETFSLGTHFINRNHQLMSTCIFFFSCRLIMFY